MNPNNNVDGMILFVGYGLSQHMMVKQQQEN
jgi:hypothetical protein